MPTRPRAISVVPMRRRDLYRDPDFPDLGNLSREEITQLRSRGPSAVPMHRVQRALGDTHGSHPNWIAMHHTADRFGFRLTKLSKSMRIYKHPESKDVLRLHWNDPANDAWSYVFGQHVHKHEKNEPCNVGVSNEDLATHLANAATDQPRWICQHALNRAEPSAVRQHRFNESIRRRSIMDINTPRFEHLVETRRSMYGRNRQSNASGMGSNPGYALSARHVPRRYASRPRVHARTHPRPLDWGSLYWAPGVLIPADVSGASPRQLARYLHTD